DLGTAYYKALLAAGTRLPSEGTAFVTVNRRDKDAVIPTGAKLAELGFMMAARKGTATALEAAGIEVEHLLKVSEGRPNAVDLMKSGKVQLVINTPLGTASLRHGGGAPRSRAGGQLRPAALQQTVRCTTPMRGAPAAAAAIEARRGGAAL